MSLVRRLAEIDLEGVAERDKEASSLGQAINASLHSDLEFFCFFFRVAVFKNEDLGFIGHMGFFLSHFFDHINKVFVDLGQDPVLIDRFGRP
jgi:hypothetical protein